jgi:hypothetical protein
MFGGKPERNTAGGDDGQATAGGQQARQQIELGGQLLDVVQHQQHRPLTNGIGNHPRSDGPFGVGHS